MKKSDEYLESKTLENPNFIKVVTLEHAKTYGKIVELEKDIEKHKNQMGNAWSMSIASRILTDKIKELESEIENLMKL